MANRGQTARSVYCMNVFVGMCLLVCVCWYVFVGMCLLVCS